jgi:hypothetical protein
LSSLCSHKGTGQDRRKTLTPALNTTSELTHTTVLEDSHINIYNICFFHIAKILQTLKPLANFL